jgi:hypothetical protein
VCSAEEARSAMGEGVYRLYRGGHGNLQMQLNFLANLSNLCRLVSAAFLKRQV